METKPKTEHFKIYTGYAKTEDIYKILQSMAEGWATRQIKQVRVFFAGFTDVYLSITACQWYHWSDCNDPDYSGDAMDYVTDGVFRYNYKHLSTKPRPEARWQGNWREFNTPQELQDYTQQRLARLSQV